MMVNGWTETNSSIMRRSTVHVGSKGRSSVGGSISPTKTSHRQNMSSSTSPMSTSTTSIGARNNNNTNNKNIRMKTSTTPMARRSNMYYPHHHPHHHSPHNNDERKFPFKKSVSINEKKDDDEEYPSPLSFMKKKNSYGRDTSMSTTEGEDEEGVGEMETVRILIEIVAAYELDEVGAAEAAAATSSSQAAGTSMTSSNTGTSSWPTSFEGGEVDDDNNNDNDGGGEDSDVDGGKKSISPYCVVKHRGRTIHVTQSVKNSANPVWTIDKGSLLMFSTTIGELSSPPASNISGDKVEQSSLGNKLRSMMKRTSNTECEENESSKNNFRRDGFLSSSRKRLSNNNERNERNILTFHLLTKQSSDYGISFPTSSSSSARKKSLGLVHVDASKLLDKCTEERYEFPIRFGMISKQSGTRKLFGDSTSNSANVSDSFNSLSLLDDGFTAGNTNNNRKKGPVLALRFRVATNHDLEFIRSVYDPTNGWIGGMKKQLSLRSSTSGGGVGVGVGVGGSGSKTGVGYRKLTTSFVRAAKTEVKKKKKKKKMRSTNDDDDNDEDDDDDDNDKKLIELITEKDEGEVGVQSATNALSSALSAHKSIKNHLLTSGRNKKIRIKPYPDPIRKDETEFLTKDELLREVWSPSHYWTEAGNMDEDFDCNDDHNVDGDNVDADDCGGSVIKKSKSTVLGKVYLEILSCHGLPNVDSGGMLGNLTDAFVCAVYEDCAVQTPVINDELSPYWPPWTRRAYVFPMMHPSSNLYLGVFDYDFGALLGHDPIGRVVVNVSNLFCDTEYTLKYNLYPSSNITERKSIGQISIRLRIEYTNERDVILAGLKPPPRVHVNVKKEKTFDVVRYTCFGEYNEEQFDMTVLRSYINEIFEYKSSLGYSISDAFVSLVLWRDHQVKIGESYVPLHSFIAFYVMINVVECPKLILPLMFFSLGWIMVACGVNRNLHPSPWKSCKTFWYYLSVLILKGRGGAGAGAGVDGRSGEEHHGKRRNNSKQRRRRKRDQLQQQQQQLLSSLSSEDEYDDNTSTSDYYQQQQQVWKSILESTSLPYGTTTSIEPHQNEKQAIQYELAWKQRLEYDWKVAEKRAELARKINEIGNETIHTKVPNTPAGLEIEFLSRLGRWQSMIGGVCRFLRRIKVVLTWEESIVSFWFTSACFALGFIFLILPWPFLFQFLGRIIVWTFMGPWMKIVDYIFFHNNNNNHHNNNKGSNNNCNTNNNNNKIIVKSMMQEFQEKSKLVRIKREDALKLRAVKVMQFGDYITQVPSVNLARYSDRPLFQSMAVDVRATTNTNRNRNRSRRKKNKNYNGGTNNEKSYSTNLASSPFSSSSLISSSSSSSLSSPLPPSCCAANVGVGVGIKRKGVAFDGYIPGQQLYGDMIPRPGRDARENQYQSFKQKKRIQSILMERYNTNNSTTNSNSTVTNNRHTKATEQQPQQQQQQQQQNGDGERREHDVVARHHHHYHHQQQQSNSLGTIHSTATNTTSTFGFTSKTYSEDTPAVAPAAAAAAAARPTASLSMASSSGLDCYYSGVGAGVGGGGGGGCRPFKTFSMENYMTDEISTKQQHHHHEIEQQTNINDDMLVHEEGIEVVDWDMMNSQISSRNDDHDYKEEGNSEGEEEVDSRDDDTDYNSDHNNYANNDANNDANNHCDKNKNMKQQQQHQHSPLLNEHHRCHKNHHHQKGTDTDKSDKNDTKKQNVDDNNNDDDSFQTEPRISPLYKSSDSVFVTFCRR